MEAVRLYGVAVSDTNYRLVVAALIADADPAAKELAERMAGAVTYREPVTPLTPADRDTIRRILPKPPPSGLAELGRALSDDHRARG